MKNDKKIFTKKVFEATYVTSNPDEIKKLKTSNVLTKDDVVKIDKNQNSSSMALSENENKEFIEVEYLSNMKGEKPFEINGDKYQYVWGLYPNDERQPAVYCYKDDITISYPWFKEHIAKHENIKENNNTINENNFDTTNLYKFLKDILYYLNENNIDYAQGAQILEKELVKNFDINKKQLEEGSGVLRPKDANGNDITLKTRVIVNNSEIGHVLQFGLNDKGEQVAIVELIDNRKIKTPFNQLVVDDSNKIVREEDNIVDNTNISKLQQDVKILVDKLETVLKPYLNKIDKPVEQAELIAAIAERIGVPRNKLSNIIGKLRTISDKTNQQSSNSSMALAENKKVIKTIKKKDIKNK